MLVPVGLVRRLTIACSVHWVLMRVNTGPVFDLRATHTYTHTDLSWLNEQSYVTGNVDSCTALHRGARGRRHPTCKHTPALCTIPVVPFACSPLCNAQSATCNTHLLLVQRSCTSTCSYKDLTNMCLDIPVPCKAPVVAEPTCTTKQQHSACKHTPAPCAVPVVVPARACSPRPPPLPLHMCPHPSQWDHPHCLIGCTWSTQGPKSDQRSTQYLCTAYKRTYRSLKALCTPSYIPDKRSTQYLCTAQRTTYRSLKALCTPS